MLPVVYLNGQYLQKENASLNVADLAILRGYGIFDYFRYVGGKPRFMEDHLDRFFRSAAIMDMEMPVSREELRTVIAQLIERNGGGNGGIRFVLTGGYSPDGYTPTIPNLVGLAYPFEEPAAELYEKGVKVMLHHYERQTPVVKSIDYLEGIRVQPVLRQQGFDYALYVSKSGHVRESDRSNFMIVKNGVLITPEDNVLHGITRHHLLRVARQVGIPTETRDLTVLELKAADEAIICSSTKGAMPITQVDDAPIADGKPGQVSRKLMKAWREYVR